MRDGMFYPTRQSRVDGKNENTVYPHVARTLQATRRAAHETRRAGLEPVQYWARLLKGLIAYPVDKATITMCILTEC